MGSPSRRRYPSPLVKQDLAKLGKDAESRRAAIESLRSLVEDHLDCTTLARFLQQIEDSRDGRRHVAPVLDDLARTHGPSLVPHIPRLLHLLVHNLLASADCPPLLAACGNAVVSIAHHCAGNAAEDVLRQVCLPLMGLLPNKIPPLSTGAAVCLRSLVSSEQWRFAPPTLVDDICWKAAMAAAAPPTQTVPHLLLLRSLATANASAISKFAPPLLRLSLDILLTPAATTSWQLRLSAVHLLESLLKTADYTALAVHLNPSLAALTKCRRHDKLPQVRNAVLQALQTAEALQRQQTKMSSRKENTGHHRRRLSDPFSGNMQSALPSQISCSPLTSPRRLNSLSARAPAHDKPAAEPEFLIPYLKGKEENVPSRKVVRRLQEPQRNSLKPTSSPRTRISRKPSPLRSIPLPPLHIPSSIIGQGCGYETSSRGDLRYLPEPEKDEDEISAVPSSATRDIMILDSNDELLASCQKHLRVGDNFDHSTLRGQVAEAQLAVECNGELFPITPVKRNQAVNTENKPKESFDSMTDDARDASEASVHLFNSLAQLATIDNCEDEHIIGQGGGLSLVDTPSHLNVSEVLPPSSIRLAEVASPTRKGPPIAQHQSPSEHMDIAEAETSSGSEWSVRDNPIAEDHSEDVRKEEAKSSWPRPLSPTSLPGQRSNCWTAFSSPGLATAETQIQPEEMCKQATVAKVPSIVTSHGHHHVEIHKEAHCGFVAEECWAEIEELRDKTVPSEHTWKVELQKPSLVQKRAHLNLKLLLCAGLFMLITMRVLTRGMQHHAVAQYLPPPT